MKRNRIISAICLFAVICNHPAFAGTLQRLGNSSGNWSNSANWQGSKPAAGDTVYFGDSANKSGVVLSPAQILDASFTIKGLVASNSNDVSIAALSSAYKLTIGSDGLDLSLKNCANLSISADVVLSADQEWQVADKRTLQLAALNLGPSELKIKLDGLSSLVEIKGALSGSGSITIGENSAGTLFLGGDNSYTGGTKVNSGTLKLGHARALGSSAVLVSGGTIDFNAQAANNQIDVSNGRVVGGTQFTGRITSNGGLAIGGNYDSLSIVKNANRGVNVLGELGLNILGGQFDFAGGAVTVNSNLLAAGEIDGLLFKKGLNLKESTVCNFEIGGLKTRGDYDAVSISGGTFRLDGKISLSAINSFQFSSLKSGDSFVLFDWRGATLVNNLVEFDFSNAKLAAGLSWDIADFYNNGSIKVVSIPEPDSSMLCAVAATRFLLRRRRRQA